LYTASEKPAAICLDLAIKFSSITEPKIKNTAKNYSTNLSITGSLIIWE